MQSMFPIVNSSGFLAPVSKYVWDVPHIHNQQCSDARQVSCHLIQCAPPPLTSDASCKPRLSPGLVTNWLQIGVANLWTPSSGSVNFLEGLTELRKQFPCVYQFIVNRIHTIKDSGEHLDGRDVQGKICGMGLELPCPVWVYHSPSPFTGSPTWQLGDGQMCYFDVPWGKVMQMTVVI